MNKQAKQCVVAAIAAAVVSLVVSVFYTAHGVSIALLCKPCVSYDRDVRPSVCPPV